MTRLGLDLEEEGEGFQNYKLARVDLLFTFSKLEWRSHDASDC